MSLLIEPSTVAQVEGASNFAELAAAYARESAPEGLLPPAVKMETYRALEAAGLLHVISATLDGLLIGFITVLAAPVPHYSGVVAVSESFFVLKEHRHTLAGLRLLVAAETRAAEAGAPGLLISAPTGSGLPQFLPLTGYTEVGRSFFKKVSL